MLVGPNEQSFTIHTHIITSHSTFFTAAYSKDYREGQEKLIRLPEINIDTFLVYLQWVYSGRIVITDGHGKLLGAETTTSGYPLTQLYVTAEFLGDTLLRNKIIDRLRKLAGPKRGVPTLQMIHFAYENTATAKSTLRKLFVDCIRLTGSTEFFEKHSDGLPKQLFVEMAMSWAEDSPLHTMTWRFLAKGSGCHYHEHDDVVPTCSEPEPDFFPMSPSI